MLVISGLLWFIIVAGLLTIATDPEDHLFDDEFNSWQFQVLRIGKITALIAVAVITYRIGKALLRVKLSE
ncbi:hypothetical protein [Mucilaginibacter sp. PAMB04168]|uniref:hypothetical protein n=1 Tax=Mucilaginibacter sp. PAMB04168 TaxID=3138567 RepID=UPI0031F625C6